MHVESSGCRSLLLLLLQPARLDAVSQLPTAAAPATTQRDDARAEARAAAGSAFLPAGAVSGWYSFASL